MKFSVIISIRNRANLLKHCLEGISRQEYPTEDIEICIGDVNSTDNLLSLIDRYSEVFTFKFLQFDMKKTVLPKWSYNPVSRFNSMIRHAASHPYIIKIDPEVVMKDHWIISEMAEGLVDNGSRMYNARTHFTEGEGWFDDFDSLVAAHERHYHFAEGGPFSRSKYYFCSGFSRDKFIELGGIDELFSLAVGYDDTCLREHWKNRYGSYEKEITGQAIHIWHGPPKAPPSWETMGQRIFERIKHMDKANVVRLGSNKNLVITNEPQEWGTPNILSKIYTINDGQVINVEDPSGQGKDLDLPF
jgi:glycosyltransferase involved in cell wall biosynthesis